MSRLIPLVAIIATVLVTNITAMRCGLGESNNIFEDLVRNCPRPLIDSSDQSYCCWNINQEKQYCCDIDDFVLNLGTVYLPVVVVFCLVVILALSCITCLCCRCCPWYRRRHRGTVYGKINTSNVINVIQAPSSVTPMPYSSQPSRDVIVSFPTNATGTSQLPNPPRTNEIYVRQAPYNPDFVAK